VHLMAAGRQVHGLRPPQVAVAAEHEDSYHSPWSVPVPARPNEDVVVAAARTACGIVGSP
jgi:hypothetical protein